MSSNRRVLGRIFPVIVVVVAITATIIGWRVMGSRPAPTAIIDIRNIDGEYAVLVREVEGDPERSFLSLYHVSRGEVWGALIPRYAARSEREQGVVATDEVITVRAVRNSKPFLMAFDARRGRKLGSVFPLRDEDSSPRDGAMLPGIDSLGDSGEVFEVLSREDGQEAVVGFDLARGRVRWSTALGSSPVRGARLRPTRVIVEQDDGVALLSRSDGTLRRLPAAGPICVTADAVYHASGPGGSSDARLHVVELAGASSDESRSMVAPAGLAPAGPCGTRGDVLVMAVDSQASGSGRGALIALRRDALERGDLQLAWRIALDRPWARERTTRQAPDRAPLAGELTRFVPVLLGAPDVLVMIDVDRGAIAWKSPERSSLRDARLMSAGGRHYLYEPTTGILAAFRGDAGSLDAAVILEGYSEVTPHQIAGERLWLVSGASWTILDGKTLQTAGEVSSASGITAITSRLAAELRAPGADVGEAGTTP